MAVYSPQTKRPPRAASSKKKKAINLEIERKFLLKRLPEKLLEKRKHEKLNIVQFYFFIGGIWQRFRVLKNGKNTKYIHTIKKSLSPGVYEENEKEVTKEEFDILYNKHKNKCRVIEKTRFVIKHKGLKFEIDKYEDLSLVILEVELPKLSFKFDFPNNLAEEIVMEATGIKQFSNFSLSLKNEPGKLFH